jgi:hypothetical protein
MNLKELRRVEEIIGARNSREGGSGDKLRTALSVWWMTVKVVEHTQPDLKIAMAGSMVAALGQLLHHLGIPLEDLKGAVAAFKADSKDMENDEED